MCLGRAEGTTRQPQRLGASLPHDAVLLRFLEKRVATKPGNRGEPSTDLRWQIQIFPEREEIARRIIQVAPKFIEVRHRHLAARVKVGGLRRLVEIDETLRIAR